MQTWFPNVALSVLNTLKEQCMNSSRKSHKRVKKKKKPKTKQKNANADANVVPKRSLKRVEHAEGTVSWDQRGLGPSKIFEKKLVCIYIYIQQGYFNIKKKDIFTIFSQ